MHTIRTKPLRTTPRNVKVYVEKLFLYYVLLLILYYCVIASPVFWSFGNGRSKTHFWDPSHKQTEYKFTGEH